MNTHSRSVYGTLREFRNSLELVLEEKEMYYSITAEMIIAQPSSHSVTDNPGTLAARV